jgi:uncharacterized protein (TIGR03067 family)
MKVFQPVITMVCLIASVAANAGDQLNADVNCATAIQSNAMELKRLQGTWEGVAVGDRSKKQITITITGNSLHFFRDAKFWFETTITLPAGTNPQQLHATIKDSAPPKDAVGEVVRAIFKIEDGTLTLATGGDEGEGTPKSFEATDGQGPARYELRKIEPQKKNSEPPKAK